VISEIEMYKVLCKILPGGQLNATTTSAAFGIIYENVAESITSEVGGKLSFFWSNNVVP